MKDVVIVGVDAAAQPENVALARTVLRDRLHVEEVIATCRGRNPASIVAAWLSGVPRALVAVDAPLGWPSPLRSALASHRAGEPMPTSAHALFRRTTDLRVYERLGKQPLDVGADRIARAAHAALAFLDELRSLRAAAVPLAWVPDFEGVAAIEVYPAATLRAFGIDPGNYKKAGTAGEGARRVLVGELEHRLAFPPELAGPLLASDDPIDSVVAALAGMDFVEGHALGPNPAERPVAEREGWIWVRPAPFTTRTSPMVEPIRR